MGVFSNTTMSCVRVFSCSELPESFFPMRRIL